MLIRIFVIASYCGMIQAQSSARPMFEVASIKPSQSRQSRSGGGPGTTNPGTWSCTACSLSALITHAYQVFLYQLDLPKWANDVVFDVIAKVPEGAKREDLKTMIEGLLVDRFQLKVHRE